MQLVASLFFFSRKIILSRNSRKRRGCAGVPFGIYIAHKFHECLSLRDRFFSHRLHRFYRFFILIIRFALLLCKNRSVDLHRFYRCAMFFLPTNFTNITNVYRCAIGFSPTDYTDFIDFLFSLYDSLFCFAKIALRIYTDFIAARWFFRCSRGARTLRCYRFCYSCF